MEKMAGSSLSPTKIRLMAFMIRTVGISTLSPPSFGGPGDTDDDVVDALQEIWDVLYKKIPHSVEAKDAVFAVVRIKFFFAS